ncbi:hypothetical protein TNCV_1954291 [Trichonephila clavipes]|nr:hypothetical protein TNCV_1954291 [Trichonephila clavipes]
MELATVPFRMLPGAMAPSAPPTLRHWVRPLQRLHNLELQEPEISLPKEHTDSAIHTRRGRKVTSPKRLTYA